MDAIATLAGVTLDCPLPRQLAEFYQQVGGGEIVYSSATFVYLIVEGFGLGFQRDPAYRPPSWPDPATPQQTSTALGDDPYGSVIKEGLARLADTLRAA